MLAALLFVAAAMALVAVLLFAVVVAGIRQEPPNAEMTSRARRPTAALARLLLGVYVRRPIRRRTPTRIDAPAWPARLGRGRPMTHPAGWTTAEPCPSCGSWDITEYEIRVGSTEIRMGWECRDCGHLATWTTRASTAPAWPASGSCSRSCPCTPSPPCTASRGYGNGSRWRRRGSPTRPPGGR